MGQTVYEQDGMNKTNKLADDELLKNANTPSPRSHFHRIAEELKDNNQRHMLGETTRQAQLKEVCSIALRAASAVMAYFSLDVAASLVDDDASDCGFTHVVMPDDYGGQGQP